MALLTAEWLWIIVGMIPTGEGWRTQKKPATMPPYWPQILDRLVWDRTRTSDCEWLATNHLSHDDVKINPKETSQYICIYAGPSLGAYSLPYSFLTSVLNTLVFQIFHSVHFHILDIPSITPTTCILPTYINETTTHNNPQPHTTHSQCEYISYHICVTPRIVTAHTNTRL